MLESIFKQIFSKAYNIRVDKDVYSDNACITVEYRLDRELILAGPHAVINYFRSIDPEINAEKAGKTLDACKSRSVITRTRLRKSGKNRHYGPNAKVVI